MLRRLAALAMSALLAGPGLLSGSASPAFATVGPPAHHFTVSSSPTSPTAGVGFTVDLAALADSDNHLLDGSAINESSSYYDYNGLQCLQLSGPHDSPASASQPPLYPAAGTCPAGYSAITFVHGAASLVPVTLYDAEVVALTASDGGGQGSTSNLTVGPGTASHFDVSGFADPTTAGAEHGLTVTALDAYDNTDPSYTGTVAITSSDSNATLPADHTFTSGGGGDNGAYAGFAVTLTTAGEQSITADDGSISGSQTAITVEAAAAETLAVSAYPASTIKGASNPFTVTALDHYGNTATGYDGTVTITSTDGAATDPTDHTFTTGGGGDDGVYSGFSYAFETLGAQSLTATDTNTGTITGTQTGISVVIGPLAKFSLTPSNAPPTAGTPFTVDITAQDEQGNTLSSGETDYTGTMCLTFSGPADAPASNAPVYPAAGDGCLVVGQSAVTFDHGVASGDNAASITLFKAETVDLVVTGGDSKTGSTSLTVGPAAATHFAVDGYPDPTTAGASHDETVTALDAYDNTDTNYSGTVAITSSDSQATLPNDHTFTTGASADNGVASIAVTLQTAGVQSITATDNAHISITGSQTAITVEPGAIDHLGLEPSDSTPTAGTGITVGITAYDAYGNVLSSGTNDYNGSKCVTFSGPSDSPSATHPLYPDAGGCGSGSSAVTFDHGVASGDNAAAITLYDAEGTTLTATDDGSSKSGTAELTVGPATATALSVSGYADPTIAGDSHAITVTAIDTWGNTDPSYTGTVAITTSDLAATPPSNHTFTTGGGGDDGVYGAFSITLKTAAEQSITATDTVTGTITGSQTAITVQPGTLDHFGVTGTDGLSIADQIAGTGFAVKVTAYDAYNNVLSTGPNTFTGTVDVSSNRTCTSGCTQTAAFTDGVLASHSLTLTLTGSGSLVEVVNHGGVYGSAPSGVSAGFVVDPAPLDHFGVTATGGGTIADQIAGTGFAVKVTAYDAYNNVVSSGPNIFTGTVDVSSSQTCTAGCGESAAFTAGVLGSHSLTLTQTGSASVVEVVTHGGTAPTDPHGTSASFTVDPAPLDHFGVTPSTLSPTAGGGFTVALTAYDTFGNVVSSGPNDYDGTYCLVFSGPANSPNSDAPSYPAAVSCGANTSSTAFAHGSATSLPVTLFAAETVKLTVTNVTAKTGHSADITVAPAALHSFTFDPIGTLDLGSVRHVKAGTSFSVTARAYDQYGNLKTNYNGSPTLTGAALASSPPCATCTNGAKAAIPVAGTTETFAAGFKTFDVTSYRATTAANTATGGAYLSLTDGVTSTSEHFTVQPEVVADLDFSVVNSGEAHAIFSGQPITTKKGTPIYSSCVPATSGTDPCDASTSAPVQVLARDQFGNLTPGVVVGLATAQNPGTGFTGTVSATTGGDGIASFGSPNPLLITPSTATGTARLTASVTSGPSRDSVNFQIVDDLEACHGTSCDNLANNGQTSYSVINSASGASGFLATTTGTLDGVSLVTQFQPNQQFCAGAGTQVGKTTDVHIEALGGVPTINYKVALIIPKSLLQSSGYASRNASTFNVCFGATYLPGGTPTTLWKAKTSTTNSTLVDAVPANGLYWGWLPDCSIKKTPPTLTADNPCISLRTKTASTLQAALGLTNQQFQALHFSSGDLAIVYQTKTPWDAKGSLF